MLYQTHVCNTATVPCFTVQYCSVIFVILPLVQHHSSTVFIYVILYVVHQCFGVLAVTVTVTVLYSASTNALEACGTSCAVHLVFVSAFSTERNYIIRGVDSSTYCAVLPGLHVMLTAACVYGMFEWHTYMCTCTVERPDLGETSWWSCLTHICTWLTFAAASVHRKGRSARKPWAYSTQRPYCSVLCIVHNCSSVTARNHCGYCRVWCSLHCAVLQYITVHIHTYCTYIL